MKKVWRAIGVCVAEQVMRNRWERRTRRDRWRGDRLPEGSAPRNGGGGVWYGRLRRRVSTFQ